MPWTSHSIIRAHRAQTWPIMVAFPRFVYVLLVLIEGVSGVGTLSHHLLTCISINISRSIWNDRYCHLCFLFDFSWLRMALCIVSESENHRFLKIYTVRFESIYPLQNLPMSCFAFGPASPHWLHLVPRSWKWVTTRLQQFFRLTRESDSFEEN